MRGVITATLNKAGFDVDNAIDAMTAKAFISVKKYDLIITDVNMPGDSGIILAEYIKHNSLKNRKTPVLFLTTETSVTMRELGRETGATGWIVKPFKPEKLLEVVSKVIM
jgi:two-component system chemotaxis response regulator CheY